MGFRKQTNIERRQAGSYNENGRYEKSPAETISVMASVQPLNASESEQYTLADIEGNRTARLIKVYTDVPLLCDTEDNLTVADIVIWGGKRWKVILCEPWQSNVISHYKSIAVEVPE